MDFEIDEKIASTKKLRDFLVEWGMDEEIAKREALRYYFGTGLMVAMQDHQPCVLQESPGPCSNKGE